MPSAPAGRRPSECDSVNDRVRARTADPQSTSPAEITVSMADWSSATGVDSPATVVRNWVRSPSSTRYAIPTTAASRAAPARVPAGELEADHRARLTRRRGCR